MKNFNGLQVMSVVVCLSACLLSVGCGTPGDRPELGDVTGTVTMDGKPLPNAMVYFWPKEGGRTSRAKTDSDGYYDLVYKGNAMGAKIGMCEVRVTTMLEEETDDKGKVIQKAQEETVPAKYNDETELTFDVKPGSNTFDIKLKSGE